MITVATRIAGAHDALALAEQHDGVYAGLGIHPHNANEPDAHRLDELRELLAHDRAVAVGETGLDYFREYAPHDDQRRLFEAQLELAAELGKPVVIHTRDADEDTLAALAPHRRHGHPPLLLLARAARAGARARLVRLVRRQRHLPEGAGASRRGAPRARRPDPGRDRQPVPLPAAGPRQAQRAGERRSTRSRRSPRRAARTRPSSPARSTPTRPPPSGCERRL